MVRNMTCYRYTRGLTLLLVLVAATTSTLGQRKPQLAVVTFQSTADELNARQYGITAVGVCQRVRELGENAIARLDKYSVVERNRIDALIKENHLIATGFTDPNTSIALGRQLGADRLLMGTLIRIKLKNVPNSGVKPDDEWNYDRVAARLEFVVKIVDMATGTISSSENIIAVSRSERKSSKGNQNTAGSQDLLDKARSGAKTAGRVADSLEKSKDEKKNNGTKDVLGRLTSALTPRSGKADIKTPERIDQKKIRDKVASAVEQAEMEAAQDIAKFASSQDPPKSLPADPNGPHGTALSVMGTVIEINNSRDLTISGIPSSAVHTGMKLAVRRESTVKDARGKSPRRKVGEVEVYDVGDGFVYGVFTGREVPKKGDLVSVD